MPTSEEYTYAIPPSWSGISSTAYAEKIESLEAEVHRLKSTVELLIKKLEEMTKAGTFMTDMELLDLLEM